jgi:hypothetical protein
MSDVRVQIVLKTTDANPENFVTNSWCVKDMSPGVDDAAVTAAFKAFYDSFTAARWSNTLAQNGHLAKYSLLPGFPPNYPFAEVVWNMGAAPSGNPLPSEVAICLSMQGPRSAGFPQARRRGRVYIGPLADGNNTAGRPTAASSTALANNVLTLKNTINALPSGASLAVWSGVDSAAVEVTNGWIDNAFDTQRRRGLAWTSRTLWA